ncbi:WD40_repeat protein [Hexamita inflata]|uniref:WD40 repeat protein n=1 Tax=Hexamita inflata TaxID=28002 RepID=A0AA86TSP5_9EUKA|nr:WD40 repeat protein [Hexamita inflata]
MLFKLSYKNQTKVRHIIKRNLINSRKVAQNAFLSQLDGHIYYHKDPVRCVLLDPRSRYMFSCDHAGKILVWHSGKAAEETEKPALGQLDGHLGSKLRSLCWLHQQKALLSAGEDGKIIVHNVGQRKTCGQWQAHTDELMGIEEIQFGIEGSHVMSWSKDGRVQIWRLTFKD